MNKKRKEYIESCEISALEVLTLGGYRQKVLFEGKRKDLPVVLCLHGGPGTPVPFSVGCRGLFPEWTDRAIMVYWDQLGCGANRYPLDNGFTIEHFVGMTLDLISEIKMRFPQNKLYLFGVSWGSVLTLQAAARVPERIDGVLVSGQVIKDLFYSDEVFSAIETYAPERAKRRARKIKKDGRDADDKRLFKNLGDLTGMIRKYTNGYQNRAEKPASIGGIVKGLLTSPDYSFRDFTAVVKNSYPRAKTLWRELLNVDYTQTLCSVRVPYVMVQGDTDIVTSTRLALSTAENGGNANLRCKVIKNSGHVASEKGMAEIFKVLTAFTEGTA